VLPTLTANEEAGCRVLPLCSAGGSGDCFAAASGLVQLNDDEKEEKLKYYNGNGFVLPELPECTGLNG